MKSEVLKSDKLVSSEFIASLGLKFAIEYFYDRVVVGGFSNKVSLEDIVEARYFGEDKELRILKINGNVKAILICDEKSDEIVEVEHLVIDNKFNDIKSVRIKKYIEYDNDGQAYIKHIRPSGLS